MTGSIGSALNHLSWDDGEGLEAGPEASPVDFLCAIFRDSKQPMHRRIKAAVEAAPYCHPTLKATAVIMGSDFATRLELTIKRTEEAKLIEGRVEKVEDES
jgi:hypothetical protein